jgi:hypothetical protein
VVIPVTTQHFSMLQRNLLYTGAAREGRLVAQPEAVAIAVKGREWLILPAVPVSTCRIRAEIPTLGRPETQQPALPKPRRWQAECQAFGSSSQPEGAALFTDLPAASTTAPSALASGHFGPDRS